jgi:MFS family permease
MSATAPRQAAVGGLLRDRDFVKLWCAETVSRTGTQVTFIALPLTAIVTLHATVAQVGLLSAVEYLPYLLSLWAGVLVDRTRRRPLMVAANLGLMAFLGAIPLAAVLGVLTYPFLLAVAFGAGCLTMLFEIAQASYVPFLLSQDRLKEGNGKLEVGRSAAQASGAGLGGILVQALTAPIAILADALSYLVGAALLWRISVTEPPPQPHAAGVLREVRAGLRPLLRSGPLRALLTLAALDNLLLSAQGAIFILFLSRELHFSPWWIGLTTVASSVGGIAAGLATGRGAGAVARRDLLVAQLALAASIGVIPLAGQLSPSGALVLMMASSLLFGAGTVMLLVSVATLRQQTTPARLLGRVTAAWRLVGVGVVFVGAAGGGFAGQALGLQEVFLLAAVGLLVPIVLIGSAGRAGLPGTASPVGDEDG